MLLGLLICINFCCFSDNLRYLQWTNQKCPVPPNREGSQFWTDRSITGVYQEFEHTRCSADILARVEFNICYDETSPAASYIWRQAISHTSFAFPIAKGRSEESIWIRTSKCYKGNGFLSLVQLLLSVSSFIVMGI